MEVLEMDTAVGRKEREALFEALYLQAFPKVARFISNRNGSFDDAKDIFQDALVIYYEKSNEAGFQPKVSAEAYMLGIAKHLWLRRSQKGKLQLALSAFAADIPATEKEPDINTNRLLALLERTGKKCMDLLRSFYFEDQRITEIAAANG